MRDGFRRGPSPACAGRKGAWGQRDFVGGSPCSLFCTVLPTHPSHLSLQHQESPAAARAPSLLWLKLFPLPFVAFLLHVKNFCPHPSVPLLNHRSSCCLLVSSPFPVSGWAMPGQPCFPRRSPHADSSVPSSSLPGLHRGDSPETPPSSAPYGGNCPALMASVAEAGCGSPCSFSMPCSNPENAKMEVTAANGHTPQELCANSSSCRGEVERVDGWARRQPGERFSPLAWSIDGAQFTPFTFLFSPVPLC